nr:reverse transcriptase domain-containing protein [Tanacetum cinerariifolium]
MTVKRIDVIDMACEEYSQEVLGFFDTISSGNPTPYYDVIVSTTSPTLIPFKNSDFLLEEVDAFLAIEDEPTSSEFYQPYLDPKGDILLLEAFLNNDPSFPSPNQRNYLPEVCKELKNVKPNLTNLQLMNPQQLKSKIYLPTSNMHSWKDPEKTTFTCLYETFAYRCMPFGLCNAPGTFQRCTMAIFHDMIKKTMKVFMDDFSVFENSFQSCLSHLERMLKRCEDTNLCLNWDKSHFMVKEGIVLGHKISKQGIEFEKAKADVITKLPHPKTVKTRIETEYNYTTTGKEMLAVVKPLKFSGLATMDQQEVTMAQITQPERAVGENHASWSDKLDDALWAFRTAYKTPIECTPYKLVYEKACHLPVELEHKAYWALKHANFDLKTAGDQRKVQINELNKLHDQAYENSLIYKEKTKRLHDSKIKNRVFNIGDRVLLFNSHLKIFSGKLKSCWSGPFTMSQVYPYGTVELSQPDEPNFKINGYRVKHYFGEDIPKLVVPDLQTFLRDH